MTSPEISTPSTVTEDNHGLKAYAKEWWEKNKHTGFDYTTVREEFFPKERLQGLWEWHQAVERTWASLRNLSQDTP